jgi:hypothetical protein
MVNGMKRWIVVLLAAALTGCSSFSFKNPFAAKKGPETPELSAAQWATLRQANQERLAGEGIPGATTKPTAKVEEFFDFFEFTFWIMPNRLIDYYFGQTPARYAQMMEDDKSPDQRRTGILRLAADYEFARKEPYTRRYWQIAQGDPDALVRVAAVRALNRSRQPSVTPIAIKYLDDASPLLRLEAAKALANVPDPKAVNVLLKHLAPTIDVRGEGGRLELQPESRDVRVACADALRNYPTKDVAKALVDVLDEKDFEISWQARKSLILMTGHDYRYNQPKWREYFLKSDQPFGR